MAAALLLALAFAASFPGTVRFDFETGDLQGWRVVEGRFDKLLADRVFYHNRPAERFNHQGLRYLSTLDTADNGCDDRFTGVLESPVFLLAGPSVTFLVGGGKHPETFVALCTLEGKVRRRASGVDDETMQRVTWDVPELVGQRVFLRVVDGHTGGWGHVTFDDFSANGTLDPAATAEHFARRRPVLPGLLGLSTGDAETLRSAIADLAQTFGERYPGAAAYLRRLDELAARGETDGDAFLVLQREALLANPLVSAQPLLFVVRQQYRPDHHNTETMFQTGEINTGSFTGGGALKRLDVPSGNVTTLVEAPDGVVRDPEVSFDGRRIVFALRRNINEDYHVWEVGADGTDLRQLTSAPGVTDIDPLYLADGSVAFSSTREPKYCMCNRHIMANLHVMEPDGANILQIGKNTLHEGHGALLPDGRILYDRWEYVDRNFGDAQGLWTCNPDGTDHAVYWGNNKRSPGAVLDARPIPGTEQVICTFGSCHDRPWGALAILDRRRGIDARAAVVRTWPAQAIELVGVGDFDTFTRVTPKYEDPYPLSDRYFLCARQITGEQMGIFLVDVFGNEVEVHREGAGCFDPLPLAPRPRPAEIPPRLDRRRADGLFFVADIYQGQQMQGVARGAVKWLRVVESPEKRTWSPASWGGQGQAAPAMNWHDFNNKRILGTVPVEADGSAYLAVPADTFVYFQLLDERGRMVQSMRSGTMVQAGERSGCVGCHESRRAAPALAHPPQALGRAPSRLQGWHGEPRLFSYRAEVQPVFDRYCLSCHDWGGPAADKVVLAGDRDLTFNASYNELWRRGLIKVVGAGPAETQPAYAWGSHASRLAQALESDHHGVRVDPESYERVVTWIDLNAPYYPSYATAHPDNLAGRAPLDAAQLTRLGELTGLPFADLAGYSTNRGPQVSFDRPELSPCLSPLTGAARREALATIAAGAAELRARPEADAPGFTPCATDQRREARYAQRQAEAQRGRDAIAAGTKVYDPR